MGMHGSAGCMYFKGVSSGQSILLWVVIVGGWGPACPSPSLLTYLVLVHATASKAKHSM